MNKTKLLLSCCVFAALTVNAQNQTNNNRPEMPQQQTTVTVYDQVDDIRNQLGLDTKQFDKVYQAYNKFQTAVFGSSSSSSSMPMMGGRPGGGPGQGGPGGMQGGGRPPQGGGGPGGMGMGDFSGGGPGGAPGSNMSSSNNSNKNSAPKPPTEEEIKKQQQKIEKQEQKLEKSMKKILKDDATYNKWYKIRQQQKQSMFPPMMGGEKSQNI
jgi:hypothetical protein